MNYRLLNVGEVVLATDQFYNGNDWRTTIYPGRERTHDDPLIRRPIVSSWLPIVAGEVTFPCVFLVRDKQNPGLLMVEVAGNPSCSVPKEAIGWYPIPKQPEQLSPSEKAWAEYCRKHGIQCPDSRAQAAVKFTFLAGRASVEGDNERK